MKDIMLKITGRTIGTDPDINDEDNAIEFVTEGSIAHRGSFTLISYPESELSGFSGCTTKLMVSPGKVTMSRCGGSLDGNSEMQFEKGKRCTGVYDTPYGSLGMELLTNDIVRTYKDGCKDPAKLSIDYSICLGGQKEWRQRLDIEILQKEQRN